MRRARLAAGCRRGRAHRTLTCRRWRRAQRCRCVCRSCRISWLRGQRCDYAGCRRRRPHRLRRGRRRRRWHGRLHHVYLTLYTHVHTQHTRSASAEASLCLIRRNNLGGVGGISLGACARGCVLSSVVQCSVQMPVHVRASACRTLACCRTTYIGKATVRVCVCARVSMSTVLT